MADFKLIVINGTDEDEIENLTSTSTLKDMVREIKEEHGIDESEYGLFNLKYSNGEEFYNDQELESLTCEENETLEDFFENSERAEIIFELINAGTNDIYIGNATDENLVAEVRYGIINRQPLREIRDVEVNPNVNVAKPQAALGIHWKSGNEYYGPSLVMQNIVDPVDLDAHCPGKTQQIALNRGHREGAGAVSVGIHRKREDIKSDKMPVISFKVEPGETWVLYPGVGEHIRKAKTKRKNIFSKKQHNWLTEIGDLDPHACLKEGEKCKLCPFLAKCKNLFKRLLP